MSTPFADHFSAQARQYAVARPHYPSALFAWSAAQCRQHELAWDAGCGSGQASIGLAAYFDQVVATDPSAAQIASAPAHDRVTYRVEPAESPSLPAASTDLILVAQALHWFDQAAFHAAVQRTLRSDGCFVAVCYGLLRIDEAVDRIIGTLHHDTLGSYWPRGREHVDRGYRDLPFPYDRLTPPAIRMTHTWSVQDVLDYLSTWSAVQRYKAATGMDPVAAVSPGIRQAWGISKTTRQVEWPLTVHAGRLMRQSE
jgi:SAM-dependent methyltransferase